VRRTLAIHVDGVLADFTSAYARLCTAASGKKVSALATSWNWVRGEGVTYEQEEAVWRGIEADPAWWTGLQPLPGAGDFLSRLNELDAFHTIYFLTQRPVAAKFYTERWLESWGMLTPTVLMTAQKGKVCAALGVDRAIDDKPEHCLDIYRHLPKEAMVCLMGQPWNDWAQNEWAEEYGVKVVHTLSEWGERGEI